jgi:hypothetical protein
MNRSLNIILLCLITLSASAFWQTDKQTFYKALSSADEATIDKALMALEKEKATSRINAYKGALTMKKASFIKGVKGKVKTFKEGGALLEDERIGFQSFAGVRLELRFLVKKVVDNGKNSSRKLLANRTIE